MAWENLEAEIAAELSELAGPSVLEATAAAYDATSERSWSRRSVANECKASGCTEPRERIQGAHFCEAHRKAPTTAGKSSKCRCGRVPSPGFKVCDRCRAYHRERQRRTATTSGAYRCGVCGKRGHNARTCAERVAA